MPTDLMSMMLNWLLEVVGFCRLLGRQKSASVEDYTCFHSHLFQKI